MADPLPTWQRVTEYTVSAVPEDLCEDGHHWSVTVSWRGPDSWAVVREPYCLSRGGKWDYEPRPSSRSETWKKRHRFTEEEALRLAHKYAPTVRINGFTPADLIKKYKDEHD